MKTKKNKTKKTKYSLNSQSKKPKLNKKIPKIKKKSKLDFKIRSQPDETSCGPTCLYAVYHFYQEHISLDKVISEIKQFNKGGGTLGVILANHALKQKYRVQIYSLNLKIFDPTWKNLSNEEIIQKLKLRKDKTKSSKEKFALGKYINFLELGGKIALKDITSRLLTKYLSQNIPIICGLSCTWLYQDSREISQTNINDDVFGDPVGHFVVLYGYNKKTREVYIADPYSKNPFNSTHYYKIELKKVITAINLGVLTFDGNLIIISPK